MDETQPGLSVWRPQLLPAVVCADEFGFARYLPQPRLLCQRKCRDTERLWWGRNHYLRLARFIELACRTLEEFRQEVEELAEQLANEHAAHADTTFNVSSLDILLRAKTVEYTMSVHTIVSRVEEAQVEIGCVLGSSEVAGEYERNEEVLVTLPTQAASHRLTGSARRLLTWLRRGSWRRQEQPLSDTTASLLQTKSWNTSNELKSVLEEEGKQSPGDSSAGLDTSSGTADASIAVRDVERMRNGDGLGKEKAATAVDVEEWDESPAYSVTRKLWRLHAAVRRTLHTHTKNLRAVVKERAQHHHHPAAVLGRSVARLVVAQQVDAVCGVRAELRDAALQMARHAQQLRKFAAEAWPGQPPLEGYAVRRPAFRARQQRSFFRRMCSLLCCIRSLR